jgi:hypothetical protein
VDGIPKVTDGRILAVDGIPKVTDGRILAVDGIPKVTDGRILTTDGNFHPFNGFDYPGIVGIMGKRVSIIIHDEMRIRGYTRFTDNAVQNDAPNLLKKR